MSGTVGLLASFDYVDSAVNAIGELRKAGLKKITAYMPYPEHHIEEALGYDQSPVRVWALAGGLCGAAGGFAFTSFTSMDWPLVTGGKPILSIPAYFIIAFEMAVLFGVLSTVIGLFINTLVLRVDLCGLSFAEALERVKQGAFDAFDNDLIPFNKLVEELQPERDLSRSPLFQFRSIVRLQ